MLFAVGVILALSLLVALAAARSDLAFIFYLMMRPPLFHSRLRASTRTVDIHPRKPLVAAR